MPRSLRSRWIAHLPEDIRNGLLGHLECLNGLGQSLGEIPNHITDQTAQADHGSTPHQNVSFQSADTPEFLGKYQLIREISGGGMGVVWEAIQQPVGRRVAIKRIRSGKFASEIERQRFQIEARAVAALNHSGIVQIFEVSEHDGMPFFSMGLVHGPTLSNHIRESDLTVDETVPMVVQIATAIEYSHSKGIIHRDLKPSNVLVAEGGMTKVTDFGLARQEEFDESLTLTGEILGTPSYMSPEQARGDVASVSEVSDVYGLGGILYFVLTRKAPFPADSRAESIRKVLEEDVVEPRSLNPKIHRDLEAICLKALQKSPEARYSSAAEFRADLQRYLDGEATLARPRSALKRLWHTSRRHLSRPVVIAAICLLTLFAAVSRIDAVRGLQPSTVDSSATIETDSPGAARPREGWPPIEKEIEDKLHRELAIDLFKYNAQMFFDISPSPDDIAKSIDDMPDEPFRIGLVQLRIRVPDDVLYRLSQIRTLGAFGYYGAQTSDKDLAVFEGIKTLNWFGTAGQNVTDRTLGIISNSPIDSLQVAFTSVSDFGIGYIADTWPELVYLHVGNTPPISDRLTDNGLKALERLPLMEHLQISETDATDEIVPVLAALTKLTHLDVRKTKISDRGVATLREALPACEIHSDFE